MLKKTTALVAAQNWLGGARYPQTRTVARPAASGSQGAVGPSMAAEVACQAARPAASESLGVAPSLEAARREVAVPSSTEACRAASSPAAASLPVAFLAEACRGASSPAVACPAESLRGASRAAVAPACPALHRAAEAARTASSRGTGEEVRRPPQSPRPSHPPPRPPCSPPRPRPLRDHVRPRQPCRCPRRPPHRHFACWGGCAG